MTKSEAYPGRRSLKRTAKAMTGADARVIHTENFRSFGEKAVTTNNAKINAASAFLVVDRIIEARPNRSNSTYQAFFRAGPNAGSSRQSAMIESTAPEVPTLFEASTG